VTCHVPSPYNDFLFQRLASDPAIDLLVHYRKKYIPSHPWVEPLGQGFPNRYYENIYALDRKLLSLAMKDKESLFVIGGVGSSYRLGCLEHINAEEKTFCHLGRNT